MLSIENSIFKSLIYDEEYARRVLPHLDEKYFDGPYKILFQTYKTLFDKYNKIPTIDSLGVSFQNSKIQEAEFESIVGVVEEIVKGKGEIPDSNWLFDETEQYCIDKAIFDALSKAVSIVDGEDKNHDKGAIPDILNEALSLSFDFTIGMDYFDDAEKRFEQYTAEDSRLAYPLEALQRLSNGGHKKKALSCVLASTNTGKSAIMCWLAGEWLKRGKNVLYITLEMSEVDVIERIDANLLDVETNKIKQMKKEDFLGKVKDLKKKTLGKLVVKEYPTGGGSALHFELLCKELKQKKKFNPDIIFVDYINICASSRYKNMGGVNSYSYVKAIAEEIRGLAMKLDTCIMTGTQINRDGSNSSAPGMENTSDSFGLPMSLDFFFSLVTNEVLMENKQQMMNVLKTRWGNKSKIKTQIVGIDFDKMRYSDIDYDYRETEAMNKSSEAADKSRNKMKQITEMTSIDWGDDDE